VTDVADVERHGRRLAILAADVARADAAYAAASAEATADFAAARRRGIPSTRITLPGGQEIGLFSFYGGGQAVDVDEAELMLHVALNDPGQIEQYVLEAALRDEQVIALIAERFPHYVGRRITPAHRAQLEQQYKESGGYVTDKDGQAVKVAEITALQATGRFRYKPADRAAVLIDQALREGTLTRDGHIVSADAEPGQAAAGPGAGEAS